MAAPTPLLLRPDNFTPAARTPWGGTRICSKYKATAGTGSAPVRVGESWEVSVEPDFPSLVDPTGEKLDHVLRADPARWLGTEATRAGRSSTALLVKLLEAADDLSVQIHPDDAYAGLGPGDAGKPESWYIVERDPGSGIYLGLAAGVDRASMQRALAAGDRIDRLLTFVPVEPGDFFVIEAGMPHAIGRGVMLVEPQHVEPGKRGVTYRYWDWNRRYDARGVLDRAGASRALHVDDALQVTRWDAPRGAALWGKSRKRVGPARLAGPARIVPLCGAANAGVACKHLTVWRLDGTGSVRLEPHPAMRAITVLDGAIGLELGGAVLRIERGGSAVIPACAPSGFVRLETAHAVVSSARALTT